jgi:hypothetical protein
MLVPKIFQGVSAEQLHFIDFWPPPPKKNQVKCDVNHIYVDHEGTGCIDCQRETQHNLEATNFTTVLGVKENEVTLLFKNVRELMPK